MASEGLNLHFQCHQLVHFDLPWSLLRFQQRNVVLIVMVKTVIHKSITRREFHPPQNPPDVGVG